MNTKPLQHLWRRDYWSLKPSVLLQICWQGKVRREFWCEHLDIELVKHILLFRVLEEANLPMLDPRLSEWTVVTSNGWTFSGFEKLEEPCVSRS